MQTGATGMAVPLPPCMWSCGHEVAMGRRPGQLLTGFMQFCTQIPGAKKLLWLEVGERKDQKEGSTKQGGAEMQLDGRTVDIDSCVQQEHAREVLGVLAGVDHARRESRGPGWAHRPPPRPRVHNNPPTGGRGWDA
jgi:hypothetical protein